MFSSSHLIIIIIHRDLYSALYKSTLLYFKSTSKPLILSETLEFFFFFLKANYQCYTMLIHWVNSTWIKLLHVKREISPIVLTVAQAQEQLGLSLSVECRASILTLAGGRLQSPVSVQWSPPQHTRGFSLLSLSFTVQHRYRREIARNYYFIPLHLSFILGSKILWWQGNISELGKFLGIVIQQRKAWNKLLISGTCLHSPLHPLSRIFLTCFH